MTLNSWSATQENHVYQILYGFNDFSKYRPPHWIRHLEFYKFDSGFLISNSKNPRIPNFLQISWLFKFLPPYWIRHLEFQKFDLGIRTSNQINYYMNFYRIFYRYSKFLHTCLMNFLSLSIVMAAILVGHLEIITFATSHSKAYISRKILRGRTFLYVFSIFGQGGSKRDVNRPIYNV